MDNSPLARLPAELRVQIFSLALWVSQPIAVIVTASSGRFKAVFEVSGERSACALLDTCRAVQQEAAPIFITLNTFRIDLQRKEAFQTIEDEQNNRSNSTSAPGHEELLRPLLKFAMVLQNHRVRNARIEVDVSVSDLFTAVEGKHVVLSPLLQSVSQIRKQYLPEGSCTIRSGTTLLPSQAAELEPFISFRLDSNNWEASVTQAGWTVCRTETVLPEILVEEFEVSEPDSEGAQRKKIPRHWRKWGFSQGFMCCRRGWRR